MATSRNLIDKAGVYYALLCFGFLLFAFRSIPQHKSGELTITTSAGDVQVQSVGGYDSTPTNLTKRADEYSCSKEKPCGNGACCGGSGFCGYGPTYCGKDCVANCEAVAECGQFAKDPGTECPLKTCCSEFGFCGTTELFCGKKCQSNCVLHPKPPAASSSSSIHQKKVIGYYESWSARKACHKVNPIDLPLDALTHVNFAFAFIDPKTYDIVTMDGETPASLFQETTNLKLIKNDLSVWISVGGWTFSDNNTATQPLFGEIAASDSKRQQFAKNAVHFMQQYGFDGLDIDWEYPTAPDRGGKPDDTKNFVLLMEALRKEFDASGNKFGLTFTAPSSYWYLRHFDLPGLVKHVDWINLMSYDLHGAWDSDNPIGSIVQGHTNLTEIQLAAELFWRVDIPPEKVLIGFGFYGRSFTLADPSCIEPGCPFSGASRKGPCTKTGGILGYYEIQNIIKGADSKKRATVSPVHDEASAVNYLVFDNDQWISYDDAVTFKQKTEWADSIGLGGSLIWASDLDDDKYSAHTGLLGRPIKSNQELKLTNKALSNPQAVVQDLSGSNGQQCYKYSGPCIKLDDHEAMANACSGNTVVGWDDAGCGKKKCHCGKPICCPANTAPKGCVWRGDNNGKGAKSDCSGQCRPGEINIQGISSSRGGGFENDGNTNKCGRGKKVFCCPSPDYDSFAGKCGYTDCGKDCPLTETAIFEKTDDCFPGVGKKKFCCPTSVELRDCRWERGGAECANAVCSPTEIEVDRDSQFGSSFLHGCAFGRKQAACCTIKKRPPPAAICAADRCKLVPELCLASQDPGGALSARALQADLTPGTWNTSVYDLSKRWDNKADYQAHYFGALFIMVVAQAYPPSGELYGLGEVFRYVWRSVVGICTGQAVNQQVVADGNRPPGTENAQSEHIIDRQIMRRFVEQAAQGTTHDQPESRLPAIGRAWFDYHWHEPNAGLAAQPPVGGPHGLQPATPNDRVMECFGTYDNPRPLLGTDADINGAKGLLMDLRRPVAIDRITRAARVAVRDDTAQATTELLTLVQTGFAVFDYLNTPEATIMWNTVRSNVRLQLRYIEDAFGVPNQLLQRWWQLFTEEYFALIQRRAREWADEAIDIAGAPFMDAYNAGRTLQQHGPVMAALSVWRAQLEQRISMPVNTGWRLPELGDGSGGGPGPMGFPGSSGGFGSSGGSGSSSGSGSTSGSGS
ncbi:unnamed protein product [Zymoseptoria tritici ST99CH_3D7]|uniref:chitinase n=1 Tax=Zymoseptoria tritici (strain ST99CH_3D7) TaxID=1276538 RepID=A0A1X7S2M9_ZYMT9|nr:unnamed protein product [Zymoseptoria tritici ST99CH_3D7]